MSGAARLDGGDLFKNPVFLSAIISLLTAQFIKMLINIFKYRSRSLKDVLLTFLWKTGGMPSSHSALVVALTTSIAFIDGPASDLFVVTVFFSLVVIRDAMGVRRSAGIQARTLNILGKDLSNRFGISFRPVKEVQGHSPLQVAVGGLLGFFIAFAICTL
jgi:acid phosphatase family membrane protein YuiD